jgi:hypothetical protein
LKENIPSYLRETVDISSISSKSSKAEFELRYEDFGVYQANNHSLQAKYTAPSSSTAMKNIHVRVVHPHDSKMPHEASPFFSSNTSEIECFDLSNVTHELQKIWSTVQLQTVWKPMTFVYVYNILQIPNVAWQSYLQLDLNFPSYILGINVILGCFMTFLGIMIYKTYLVKVSWRDVYFYTALLKTFFHLCQLALIFQINQTYFHMNNYFFSLGDDVIRAFISGIQFLPIFIMYVGLSTDGAEGATYAILSTFGNIALGEL